MARGVRLLAGAASSGYEMYRVAMVNERQARLGLVYGFRRFITSCQLLWPLRVNNREFDLVQATIFHIYQ